MLQWEDVTKIITDVNNYNTDRITNLEELEKICQSICAYSNDIAGSFKNGYIIIGAKENGRLTGLKATDNMVTQIYNLKSNGNIFPNPIIEVEKFSLPTGDIILIEVIPSEYPPIRYNGKVWIKLGNRKSIAYDAEERKLTERRHKLSKSLDSQPALYTSLDSVDVKLITEKYIPQAIKNRGKVSNLGTNHALESLRLYDSRYNKATNAAIILFGKNVKDNFPGAYIRYAKFEGETKTSKLIKLKDINGNIYEQLNEIDNFFKQNIEDTTTNSVVRELLVNALIHRDYQSNTPIQIYEFCNHIEILSPGGLFGKASPENFPNVNDYRNPVIAEAVKILGNANGISSGILNAQEMLLNDKKFELFFDWTLITAFKIMLKPIPKEELNYISQLKNKLKIRKVKNNRDVEYKNTHSNYTNNDTAMEPTNNIVNNNIRLNRTSQQILKIIKLNPGCSSPIIANKTKKSLPTIKRHIAELKEMGLIEFIGASKNGGYYLK